MQNEGVYNVTYHCGVDRPCHREGVDNPNYASKADVEYDSLRFETNNESGNKTKTTQEFQSNFESEYSRLSY
jgi:DNA polymerase II small subunit/DNA polymerase delta subunit B